MKERAEINKKRPKVAVKRVSVAANQKFEEVSDANSYNRKKRTSLPPVGEVRKYVRDMKDKQLSMLNRSRASYEKRESINGLKVDGQATGSSFYPHGSLATGGVTVNQYG